MVLRKRALLTAGATLTCLGVAACTPAGPPTPTPTPVVTPSETQLERQARLDFEAAEKSYRTFIAEFDRLTNSGGRMSATEVMKATAGGPFLQAYVKTLENAYTSGAYATGSTKILWVRRGTYSPNELQLNACIDGTGIQIFDSSDKKLGTGAIGTENMRARRLDGRWKIWESETQKDSQCAAR